MKKITVQEVAKYMGVSDQTLRIMITRKMVDFAIAVPSKSGARHNYIFFESKLKECLGFEC